MALALNETRSSTNAGQKKISIACLLELYFAIGAPFAGGAGDRDVFRVSVYLHYGSPHSRN